MKRRLLALTILAAIPGAPPAAEGSGAILRCDPGMQILSIDGDRKRAVGADDHRHDCNLPMKPGPHVLLVKFEHGAVGDSYFDTRFWTRQDLQVTFEAESGRTYRLKGGFTPDWHAWVVDVTSQEYDSPWPPSAYPKERRAAAKGKPKSILVAKLSPRNVVILSADGQMRSPWFVPAELKPLAIRKKDQATGDLAFVEVTEGTSLGIYDAIINGNAFSLEKNWGYVCGETQVPVFENLAGSRVYYLGRFDFTAVPTGLEFRFTQEDLESVRHSLQGAHPELAHVLEPASVRSARIRRPCEIVMPGRIWSNSGFE
jgi:hypothetical protein